jgi:hypothetical protein
VESARRSDPNRLLLRARRQPADDRVDPGASLVGYSLVAGTFAMAVGAAVSLLAAGPARVAVWCTVAALVSVTAGLVRESGPVSAGRCFCRHWLSRLAGS